MLGPARRHFQGHGNVEHVNCCSGSISNITPGHLNGPAICLLHGKAPALAEIRRPQKDQHQYNGQKCGNLCGVHVTLAKSTSLRKNLRSQWQLIAQNLILISALRITRKG
jgi:hypothetical protein